MEILTDNPNQTKKVGAILAKELQKTFSKKARVVGLIADLGGGKTTFLQGFAKGLGIKEKILSPTFVIVKRFKIKDQSTKAKLSARPSSQQDEGSGLRFKNFYHIDCYRVEKPKEILNLGFKEIISNSQNIIAVEWADRIKKILPKDSIILKFEFLNKNKRKIIFQRK